MSGDAVKHFSPGTLLSTSASKTIRLHRNGPQSIAAASDTVPMARKRRAIADGDVVHARTRFVNEEFRIRDDDERQQVLGKLAPARRHGGVLILAFALMSSHIHLLLRGSAAQIEAFYRSRSFHTSLGMLLNRNQGRFGPVVADRPWVDVVTGETIFTVLRYVHGNQREAFARRTFAAPTGRVTPCSRTWIGVLTGLPPTKRQL